MNPSIPVKIVKKPWGREIWVAHTDQYAFKIIEIRAGTRPASNIMSASTSTSTSMRACCKWNGKTRRGKWSLSRFIPAKSSRTSRRRKHRAIAVEDVRLLEVSTPELDNVVRVQDDYHR